ncbi:MAG TPA: fructosamine kinase family protein [Ilumatobacter sp.]|nr:fructosamine kinase family protein [Ilumatobacter sp.]
MADPSEISTVVAHALDVDVVAAVRLGGGDVAESFRVELADGRSVFAKTHRDPPPHFFTTEAAGLEWLRAADAALVAEVLAVGDDPAHLVLGWIDETRHSRADDEVFGRQLAAVHRAGAPSFGRADRRTTGSLGVPNDPCDTWAEFYAERRLLPLAQLAMDRHVLPAATVRELEAVAARLDQFGAADEPPSRLHGDLWAGNRVVDTEGRSWLIDPAAHGGHREFDLAMMQLFGGFAPETFVGYQDAHPLADGWRDRVPLHQLAPLTVHAIKFGGGYVAATQRALHATLSL